MKKLNKGEFGYRNRFIGQRILFILFFAALVALQLASRFLIENVHFKAIITVSAIFTVFPGANLAASLLAMGRYRTPPAEFKKKYSRYEKDFCLLYDLIISRYKEILPLDLLVVHPTGYYGFCPRENGDFSAAEKEINNILVQNHLDPHFHVTNDRKAFDRRLETLKPASEYEDDGSVEYAAETFCNLSF